MTKIFYQLSIGEAAFGQKSPQRNVGGDDSSVDPSMPNILRPRIESQTQEQQQLFFSGEKNENKQNEAGIGQYLKITILR